MLRVTIGLDRDDIPELTSGSQTIHDKMNGDQATYGGAPVAMTDFQTQITDVNTKHQATKTNKNAIGARTASVGTLWTSLSLLCTFVQSQMDKATPDKAQAIAEGSGFHVIQAGHAQKNLINASLTNNKGEVELDAYASKLQAPSGKPSKQRTYHWRGSQDGWKTIQDFGTSPTHKKVVQGLPLNSDWEFEVAVEDDTGMSQWYGTAKIHVF
jgi:hypothetical protein